MANDTPVTNGNHPEPELSQLTMATKPPFETPLVVRKGTGMANGAADSIVNRSDSHGESRSETKLTRISMSTGSETRTNTTKTNSESRSQFSKDQQITVLRDTVISCRGKFIAEFSHVDEHYINFITIESCLDYIERQRLTHMPHRGSRWDKVLKWAEYFALQVSGFAKAVGSFIPDSKIAANLILTASRVLLELGPSNAQALETTFGVFYKLGLSLSFFLRHESLLHIDSHIRMEVGHAFNALLVLVREVSVYYYSRINSISSSDVTIDFNSVFGRYMETFHRNRNHITDAMWENTLDDDFSVDIRAIRKWLGPRDRVLKTILDDSLAARGRRDEYTCEWFHRYLVDFSRGKDDILAVTGPAGSGKSVIADWVVERLQRPLGRKTYQTLSYTIEADIPGKSSSLEIAKNLTLQLLESNVGDVDFFRALVKSYNVSVEPNDARKLEDYLWKALDTGLKSIAKTPEDLMIVVDGLDEVSGDINTICKQLNNLASSHSHVQTLIFSREPVPSADRVKIHSLKITPDQIHDDLRHMTEHALNRLEHFRDQSEHARESIVEQMVHAAKGNFLWILLTAVSLKHETSHEGFMKAVKGTKEAPKTLGETIQKLTDSLDFSKSDTNLLLSLLLVAERPLTLAEVRCLLQIDLHKGTSVERTTEIQDDIKKACGPLLVIQNGVVRFRHSAIRSHVMKIRSEGTKLMTYKAAQTDLTMRVLAYCKFNLTQTYEPAFEQVDMVDVAELFNKHSLLEYAVRHWTLHFRNSSMHNNGGHLALPKEFKAIFPGSTRLVMLEWTCWEAQTSPYVAVDMHDLALRLRQDVFTEKHESVLQSLIVCGKLYQNLSKIMEAGTCFYRASHIGQSILRKHSALTITCTQAFLTTTKTITITTRTEVFSRREEMLKFIIVACKRQCGETSEMVIRYYKMLAQLYADIRDDQQAEIIWREVREIIIKRHGKGSEEELSVSEQLTITLKKGKSDKDVIEYERGIFDITMEMEVWDVRRIKTTLELAVSYEARGEYFMAEELYVMLWGRLVEHRHQSHHHHGIEVHISMIDIAIEYVRFLRRRQRHQEASNILICIWTEYEEYDFESETIFLRLKIVGEIMRAISLLSIAVSVFKKCRAWFKSHSKHEHTTSCEVLISETVEEMITSTSTTTVSITTSRTTETVIKEVFESTLSRTTVTSETISIIKSLLSYHIKLEQWSEAVEVSKRSLALIWKMIISGGGICALPRDFGSEAIDIAIHLAICHDRLQHYHEAEEVYLRVYRACLKSCNLHDERLTKSSGILIKFYEEHRHWHKTIMIHQELLSEYRRHLGASHNLTIKTLYILGSLCADHGHGHALQYYEEIVEILNGGARVCHHDSTEAMIILCRIYYEEGHWHKLKDVCVVLWETWTHYHHEYKFSADFIGVLYMRYRYVLEHHYHCEYEVLRTITIQFRDICIKVFGASVAITITALIEFAQICMRSEKHIHEAISTYEEVLMKTTTTATATTTTTVISSTTLTTIKERLVKAYVTVCSHGSTSSTTIERAIKVLSERFEHLKVNFGCAHTETITVLRELVLLYKKLKTQEAHSIVKRMLLNMTIEIITKENGSKQLYEVAQSIGGIYISFDLHEYGHEILRELRRQIITGTPTPGNKLGLKLGKSTGRVSYVFLVAFEETIRGSMTSSYSKIMADLLIETTLYESYTRCLKSETKIELIIAHGARLRAFWHTRKQLDQVAILQDQLYEIFLKKWGSVMKTRRELTFIFFVSLLEEIKEVRADIQIGDVACQSGNNKVRVLLTEGNYQQAHEVALCAFQFVNYHRRYHELHNVGHGFKLSALMAGRGLEHRSEKPIEPQLRKQMLELSRTVIREVLQACKDSKIDFVRLQLRELNDLVGLLGEQQNYADLEWLLDALWKSRKVQKTWSPETITAIGRRLVEARFLGGHRTDAIRLCESICYNLRRVRGPLEPLTLEMFDLLSRIYTAAGHYREAMGVHEDIIRIVVDYDGQDDDGRPLPTLTPRIARKHLDMLQRSYLRLKGWDKSKSTYMDLVQRLLATKQYKGDAAFAGVQPADKWNPKEEADAMGTFSAPADWAFVDPGNITDKGEVKTPEMPKRPGTSPWRATSNWGMGLIYRHLHGHDDDQRSLHEENGLPVRNGVKA